MVSRGASFEQNIWVFKKSLEIKKTNLVKLANEGYQKALGEDKNFLAGLNVHKGHVTYKAVADIFGHEYVKAGDAIKN